MRSIFILPLAALVLGAPALACSCGSYSNFYRAAATEGAQVALLQTTRTVKRGEVEARVLKTYQGSTVQQGDAITLSGQDGLNCRGSVSYDTKGTWIALFAKDKDGSLGTLSCASTLLQVNNGEIQGGLLDDGATTVSEAELENLLSGTQTPTLSLSCSLTAMDRTGKRAVQIHETEKGPLPASLTLKKTVEGHDLWFNVRYGEPRRSLSLSYRNLTDGSVVSSQHDPNPMAPTPHVMSSVRSADYKVRTAVSCSLLQGLPLH